MSLQHLLLITGHADIDYQHSQLVALLSQLRQHDIKDHEKCQLYVQKVNEQLAFHLDFEEDYMAAANFPGLAEHKKKHDILRNHIKVVQETWFRDSQISFLEAISLIFEYVSDHLHTDDELFAAFLKQRR